MKNVQISSFHESILVSENQTDKQEKEARQRGGGADPYSIIKIYQHKIPILIILPFNLTLLPFNLTLLPFNLLLLIVKQKILPSKIILTYKKIILPSKIILTYKKIILPSKIILTNKKIILPSKLIIVHLAKKDISE